MSGAFQVGPFQTNFQQEGVVVTPFVPVDVGGGIPSGVTAPARRRYIMPDGRMFLATTDEALQLLRLYSVPKEAPAAPPKQAKGQPVIRAPQITLEKRDVRFVPATDSAEGTYKAVISERFVYSAPEEAYRQAEIMLNRMRDDEEALLLLL